MKNLQDIITEELLLEYFINTFNDYKVSLDMSKHSEDRQDRQDREDTNYISKTEINYTIYKVIKLIREDFDENIININDRIQIIDKSRDIELNIICDIKNDKKYADWIRLLIITEMENNMPTHDIKKIYSTYISDKKIQKSTKLFKKLF